jgi:hypothetical protein
VTWVPFGENIQNKSLILATWVRFGENIQNKSLILATWVRFGENIQNTALKLHVTLAPLARNIQYKAMIPRVPWTPCAPSTVDSNVY